MSFRSLCSVLALSAMAFSHSTFAHHASAPHFDPNKSVEITGVITDFKLVNPHAYLYLDVTDANGKVANWNCEMNAASTLRRFGWTQDLFPVGAEITVEGWAARRDDVGCAFQKGTLVDGTEVERAGTITAPGETQVAEIESEDKKDLQVDLTSIAGTWITSIRSGPPEGTGPWTNIEDLYTKMTEAGISASQGYDMRFDDPALQCSPSSIVRGWGEPNSISEITVTDKQVTIKHAYMDTVRAIDLTAKSHPENIEPSLTGHSIGHFEDGKLIVETAGFAPGVLLPHPGVMNSDELRIIETISLEAGGLQLRNVATIHDGKFLKEPLTTVGNWTRTSEALPVYNCTELSGKNNERPAE